MAGILQKRMQPDQAPYQNPQEQEPEQTGETEPESAGESEPEGQREQASPQEQEAYDRVVAAGMKVMYDKNLHAKIMQMLQAGADNPPQALAQVVALIITQLGAKAKGQIPPGVILPAAEELMALAAEDAQKAGFFKADDELIKQGMVLVIKQLTQQGQGQQPQQPQAQPQQQQPME